MAEPDLPLQLLIIAFDAPAQLDRVDELIEGDVGRQGREPVLGRPRFALGPLDDEPFLGPQQGRADCRDEPQRRAPAPTAR